MHYARKRKNGEVGSAEPIPVWARNPDASRINRQGYVVVNRVDRRQKLEHRHVMEQMLGRPLRDFENVHHINGVRHDNRPENLELWTKPQPCGQRPEDLVAWVVENYREMVVNHLAGER